MTSPSCDQCATTKCIASGNTDSTQQSRGSDTGAIAGGVVGGLAGLAVILFLVYWFVIRKRRHERAEQQEKSNQFAAARSERQSTQSIASTVLTRASNVIQIAYIPGVTNRSPPDTPASLVPPVPPLPGAHPDQYLFMPGDLRDSSWTTTTGGHLSMSPTLRSSVATTIYRSNAIVSPMPAQQITRTRANIVSVHTGPNSGATTPTTHETSVVITPPDAPAVPAITSSQLAKAGANQKGALSASSINTSSSSIVARTVMAKPVMVRGTSQKKKDGLKISGTGIDDAQAARPSIAVSATSSHQFDHHTSTFDGNSSDDDDDIRSSSPSRSTTVKVPSISVSEVADSPDREMDSSPFDDPTTTKGNPSTSKRSSHHDGQTPPPRVRSPFSDANEVP